MGIEKNTQHVKCLIENLMLEKKVKEVYEDYFFERDGHDDLNHEKSMEVLIAIEMSSDTSLYESTTCDMSGMIPKNIMLQHILGILENDYEHMTMQEIVYAVKKMVALAGYKENELLEGIASIVCLIQAMADAEPQMRGNLEYKSLIKRYCAEDGYKGNFLKCIRIVAGICDDYEKENEYVQKILRDIEYMVRDDNKEKYTDDILIQLSRIRNY